MNAKVTSILSEITSLTEEERIAIADGIWHGLSESGKDELYAMDPYIDPENREEIDRRLKESREHPERLIHGDVVLERLKKRYVATVPA